MVRTDDQPLCNFNIARLFLLPKGISTEEELGGEYRKGSDTRPLSASNCDEKSVAAMLNIPFAEALPAFAHESQQRFTHGRQLVNNVVRLDGQARIAAAAYSEAVLLFLDFCAASPSIYWGYLFLALEAAGVPTPMRKAIENCMSIVYTSCPSRAQSQ